MIVLTCVCEGQLVVIYSSNMAVLGFVALKKKPKNKEARSSDGYGDKSDSTWF